MILEYTIHIEELLLTAGHGVHPLETVGGNQFQISLQIKYNGGDEVVTTLSQTIDYAAVYELVKTIFAKPRPLLETVADNIVRAIHAQYPIAKEINISIFKLTAPITGFNGKVGVSLTRHF